MKKPKVVKVAPAAAEAPKVPSMICPKCQTAAIVPEQAMAVSAFGYSAVHCLKCWVDVIRQAVPALVPIPASEPKKA